MTSLSATEYIRKNLHDIDFFMFSKHFKYVQSEAGLAMRHFIGNLAMLGTLLVDTSLFAEINKRPAERFWISVEAELGEDHFAKNIRRIQVCSSCFLNNQIVDAEKHHSQFGTVSEVEREQTPEIFTREDDDQDVFRHPVSSDSMPSTPSKRLSSSEVPLPTSDSKKPRINNLDVSFDEFIDSSSSEKGETATTLVSESSEDELTIAVNEGDIDDSLFVAIESMIDKLRRRPSGTLRSPENCYGASGSSKEQAIRSTRSCVQTLHVLQQVSTAALVDLCGQMRIEGAAGLLKRLATLDAKVFVPRPASLEELLGGSEHGNDAMKTTAEDLKDVSTEEEVQWIFHVLDEIIRIVRSNFLATNLTERDVDISLLKPFLDTLWDIAHLHYGEGESRASRNRRNDIDDKRCIGDKFD
ncbi:hypothetical protein BC938DRAFT_479501 [Jimgerdemannia flammicorona]|uniref:Uncharacterized protein n=1 Tax=Jimgerdemannia flammicorona TaxID=994334 RepID=A0A433QKQ8_9FUNG|nr:hypothetical protein BC938DRAFT_479501 [Jimgerdemannia flammicorona]